MTLDDIAARLQEILRRELDAPDLVLSREMVAADVPGWDSVRQVAIILEVEDAFGIALRSREIDRLRNVGDFLDVISKKAVLF